MLKTTLTGNIGQDAEIRPVNGVNAISFTVAVNESYTDKNGTKQTTTTWVSCTLWRKPEQSRIAEFLKKGTKVLLEGKPSARGWLNKQDGSPQAALELRVDMVELLGDAKPTASAPAPQQYAQPVQQPNYQAQPHSGAQPAYAQPAYHQPAPGQPVQHAGQPAQPWVNNPDQDLPFS